MDTPVPRRMVRVLGNTFAMKTSLIGIGEAVARLPLPHHRAYGSVHGGSIGYASSLRLMKEGQAI